MGATIGGGIFVWRWGALAGVLVAAGTLRIHVDRRGRTAASPRSTDAPLPLSWPATPAGEPLAGPVEPRERYLAR